MSLETHSITLCLGSSCFVNGNSTLLETIKKFIAAQKLENIEIKGSLCQSRCKDGPSMTIDGKLYTKLTVPKLQTILESHLLPSGKVA